MAKISGKVHNSFSFSTNLEELVEVGHLQQREAGYVVDELLDFRGILFGCVV